MHSVLNPNPTIGTLQTTPHSTSMNPAKMLATDQARNALPFQLASSVHYHQVPVVFHPDGNTPTQKPVAGQQHHPTHDTENPMKDRYPYQESRRAFGKEPILFRLIGYFFFLHMNL